MKKILLMALFFCLTLVANAQSVQITEAKGWLESVYVKFGLLEGAKSYHVYINGGQYADYIKVDDQLVRNYGTYGRADAVGLQAGSYSIKVVPVNAEGTELTDKASEVTGLEVNNYNRDGYAHYNVSEGVGAYNNDGTLKSGARVIYVTKDNAKTITLSMKVGNNEETRTGIQDILQAYEKGVETRPLAVRIIGQLKKADMPELGSSAIGLQVKGKSQNMNLTIEGIGNDATFHGFGVLARNCRYVELRNFAIMMHPEDGISFDTNNEHVWGHHLDIFYGENKGGDKTKGDGSFDVKGTMYCTVSDNHFWDSGKCNLNSNGDEVDFVTYRHNWYDHSDSRHPRVRKSQHLHVYNNYYDGNAKYGVGATTGSCIFVEKNYFRNCKYPMLISKQGSDVHNGVGTSDQTKGTFSKEDGGIIKAFDNYMTGQVSFEPYVAGDELYSKHFDAYVVENRNDQVPADVVTLQGGTNYNNFDTANDFYQYTPDATADVPAVVTGHFGAGRCEHGDFQYTFDNATQDGNSDVITDLSNNLKNYNTSLVGFFGDENASGGGDEPGGDEPGGDEPGGGDPSVGVGTYTVSFENSNWTQSTAGYFKSVGGKNSVNDKFAGMYNGVSYAKGLKMESTTKVQFTTTHTFDITIVRSTASGADKTIKYGPADSETELTFVAIPDDDNNKNVAVATLTDQIAGTYQIVRGSGEAGILFVSVTEKADATVPVTISASGYSSFSSSSALDFSSVDGLEAYVVSAISNTAATLTKVTQAPAKTGLILKGTSGNSYNIPTLASAPEVGINYLQNAVTATAIAAGEAYGLKDGKFVPLAAGAIPAGKAYLLAADIPTNAAELTLDFGNGTTGINSLTPSPSPKGDGSVYNLNGQRVAQPTKGLYIVNGKKIVVK